MSEDKNTTVEVNSDNVEENIVPRSYNLRPLNDEDAWIVLDILIKTIPEDLKESFSSIMSKEKSIKEIGYDVASDMIIRVVRNIPKAKEEVYAFCAGVSGMSVEELKNSSFGTTPLILMDIFEECKNQSFFKELSKFFS